MGVKTRKLGNINDSLIQWQAVTVADGSTGLTAVSGRGYFINTTAGVITVTLPASPNIGDTIMIVDYASTFATNNVTINPNSNKIEAGTGNGTLLTNDQTHTLVFTDSTQGWKIVNQDTASGIQASYISATGGTVTTTGTNFKVHSFTGDGNFVVSSIGNDVGGGAVVDYLVVAGGGGAGGSGSTSGGGGYGSGAGGAGGYRESSGAASGCFTVSPLGNSVAGITVSAQTYPITVGAGGAGGPTPAPSNPAQIGARGSNSVFSTITSTGGGGGAGAQGNALPGGSGGGKSQAGANGCGNTPPVSPPQGNNGGSTDGNGNVGGGGGGGATTAGGQGGAACSPAVGGAGGTGATSHITGSPVVRAGGGGGGGGADHPACRAGGAAGSGGGGAGGNTGCAGAAGTANTGGGGGASGGNPGKTGAAGGKGIVIIRYKFQG